MTVFPLLALQATQPPVWFKLSLTFTDSPIQNKALVRSLLVVILLCFVVHLLALHFSHASGMALWMVGCCLAQWSTALI